MTDQKTLGGKKIQQDMTAEILQLADVEAQTDCHGAWRKFVADIWTR